MDEHAPEQIFEEWMSQHRGLIFKVVRAYAFTPHDQDDLFQEIITQVWNSIPRFRAESAVTTWLYRVALNTAWAWSRKERKHRTRTQALDGTAPVLIEKPRAPEPRLDWLYDQIASLDHIDRSLTLLLLDGFSYREIAETIGITENHVGVKINRIKTHLINQSKQKEHHGI